MLTGTQINNTFETFLTRLNESHELPVYEAIERLVLAGEAVGIRSDVLLRMLDRGMTFVQLLEFIESKMECWRNAA